jgi:hypothetical protein
LEAEFYSFEDFPDKEFTIGENLINQWEKEYKVDFSPIPLIDFID